MAEVEVEGECVAEDASGQLIRASGVTRLLQKLIRCMKGKVVGCGRGREGGRVWTNAELKVNNDEAEEEKERDIRDTAKFSSAERFSRFHKFRDYFVI